MLFPEGASMSLTYGFSKEATKKEAGLYPAIEEIATLFERFIQEKRFLENRSEATIKSYKLVFWRYQKYTDATQLPTPAILSRFVMEMRQAGLSVSTCNICIRSFNSFLTWLTDNQYLQEPLRIKKLKEEKRVLKTFTDEQLKALLNWRPKQKSRNECRIYAILCTLTDCGLRISECLAIELAKVDFDNLLITVIGKGNKERVVPMSIELRKTLYRYVKKQRTAKFDSKYLFCTGTGNKMTYRNAYRDLEMVMHSVGVDKKEVHGFFHAFRRKFARAYVKAGGNLFYLQTAMGHTTLQMTKHYVEVDAEDLQAAHVKTSLLSRLR
jgi:integrase/recombinase XerD